MMWLINTTSFCPELIQDPQDVPFAMLLYAWADEEVLFQDPVHVVIVGNKEGHAKSRRTCQLAASKGL